MMRLLMSVRVFLLCFPIAGLLAGCAGGVGMDESTMFADPARYALYDCKQLATARQGHAARVEELKRLMAKAETGPAGGVMSELAYRSDFLSAQAQLKTVNATIERNRCDSETVASNPAPASPSAGRSAGRIY